MDLFFLLLAISAVAWALIVSAHARLCRRLADVHREHARALERRHEAVMRAARDTGAHELIRRVEEADRLARELIASEREARGVVVTVIRDANAS